MNNLIHDWSSWFCPNGKISAWTSLKNEGVSSPPYDSLNLSFEVGDDPNQVLENRRKVRKETKDIHLWIEAKQVHDAQCHFIEDNEDLSTYKHPWDPSAIWIEGVDAFVTRRKDITLIVKHADCQPALLYDPVSETIGIIHAGWRGLISGVYENCLEMMTQRGVDAKNLKIMIGPSLGACCSQFINGEKELGEKAREFQVKPFYYDLKALAFDLLRRMGVTLEHIYIHKVCTRCENSLYFSFRSSLAKTTGRLASGIRLLR